MSSPFSITVPGQPVASLNGDINQLQGAKGEGRTYCCEKNWEMFPGLVTHLLEGCEKELTFKMSKQGRSPGTINVILASEGVFHPRVLTSGSLAVLAPASYARNFLSQFYLSKYFQLKTENKEAAEAIQSIFKEVIKGNSKAEYVLQDGSKIIYLETEGDGEFLFTCSIQGKHTRANVKIKNIVESFFSHVDPLSLRIHSP